MKQDLFPDMDTLQKYEGVDNLSISKMCEKLLLSNGEKIPKTKAQHNYKKETVLPALQPYADIEEYIPKAQKRKRYKIIKVYANGRNNGNTKENDNTPSDYEPYFSTLLKNMINKEHASGTNTFLKTHTDLTAGLGYMTKNYIELRATAFSKEKLSTFCKKHKIQSPEYFESTIATLSKTVNELHFNRIPTLSKYKVDTQKLWVYGKQIEKKYIITKLKPNNIPFWEERYFNPALDIFNNYYPKAYELSNECLKMDMSKKGLNHHNIYKCWEFALSNGFTPTNINDSFLARCKQELNSNIIKRFKFVIGYDYISTTKATLKHYKNDIDTIINLCII